jgi:hypothetical protein
MTAEAVPPATSSIPTPTTPDSPTSEPASEPTPTSEPASEPASVCSDYEFHPEVSTAEAVHQLEQEVVCLSETCARLTSQVWALEARLHEVSLENTTLSAHNLGLRESVRRMASGRSSWLDSHPAQPDLPLALGPDPST